MGGRGSGSRMSNNGSFVSGLKDNTDFRSFIRENMSNSEFKKFGQEHGMDEVHDLWIETRAQQEMKNLHEMNIEDAISQVRDAIPNNELDGWFRDANSDYKPKLAESIMSNPGTLNAGMNIAYYNHVLNNYGRYNSVTGAFEPYDGSSKPPSFNKWLNTPQKMYRGDRGQKTVASDIFTSFTPDKSMAQRFGDNITTRMIKPKDTWGSFQTTGEQEFLVPVKRRR